MNFGLLTLFDQKVRGGQERIRNAYAIGVQASPPRGNHWTDRGMDADRNASARCQEKRWMAHMRQEWRISTRFAERIIVALSSLAVAPVLIGPLQALLAILPGLRLALFNTTALHVRTACDIL